MLNLIIGIVIGLVIGWNFFPQPVAVKNWISKILGD